MSTESGSASGRGGHVVFADVLRAVAIAMVVCGHLAPAIGILDRAGHPDWMLDYFGVDAFFVLSGFLLGGPFVDAILGVRAYPDPARYAQRRILRIYPAYVFVLVVSSFAANAGGGPHRVSPLDLAAHLAMLQNFFPAFVQDGVNNALWTMGVDAQFYVALPIVAALAIRVRPKALARRGGFVVALLAAVAIFSLCFRVFATNVFSTSAFANAEFTLQRNVLGMGFAFASGVALAFARGSGFTLGRRGRIAVLFAGMAALDAMLFLTGADRYRDPYTLMLLDVCGTFAATAFLLGFAGASRFARALQSSRFVRIAAAGSYAVYLVHFPLRSPIYSALGQLKLSIHTSAGDSVYLAMFSSIAAIAAAIVYRYVEAPFLALKERRRVLA